MKNWAYIENNTIIETFESLPICHKNVSNLSAAENDLVFLKSIGWHKIEHNVVEYDPSIQNIKSLGVTYDGDKVTELLEVENISNSSLYENFMRVLRTERNKLLQESDFMCLYDIVSLKGQEYLNDITTYRQQLRDLPNLYPNNNTVYNISDVIWPTKVNFNNY